MTENEHGHSPELSRRKLFTAAGLSTSAAVAATLIGTAESHAAISAAQPVGDVATPAVGGLHLQFGGDASSEVTVSWHTLRPVQQPRVVLGRPDGRFEQTVAATPSSYTDAKKGQVVYAYHAKITGLQADTEYMYGALHEGSAPEFGTFRTSPRGRQPFTFTSFGDQGTPTMAKKFIAPVGMTVPGVYFVNDNLGSPAAGDVVLGVEQLRPLFHLFNGDLCYANLSEDRVRTWWDFWENNTRSGPQPSVDAVARQSRERAWQRADRLSGVSDLFLGAASRRAKRRYAGSMVCFHRRCRSRRRHRKR